MSSFGRKLMLGASIVGATTFLSPAQAQDNKNNKGNDVKTEQVVGLYEGHADTLYNALFNRYSEYSPETAEKLAKKSTEAYLQLLDEGKVAQADTFMMILHENFEKKEVDAARKKAYTPDVNDPEKLRITKSNALAKYKECLKLEKAFKILDAQREQMKAEEEEEYNKKLAERDSLAREEGIDPQTLPPLKLRRSDKSIGLDVKHSNNMTSSINAKTALAALDVIVYEQQLRKNLAQDKQELKAKKNALKEWNKLQKQIDVLQKQLDGKLALIDYYTEKLNEENEHDKKVAKQSQETALANYARNEEAKKIEAMKVALEKRQAKLGTEEEIKGRISELEKEIAVIKDKLRKKDFENEAFKKDGYEGSVLQKAANGVKSDRGIAVEGKSEAEGVAAPVKGGKTITYSAVASDGKRRATASSLPTAVAQTAHKTTSTGVKQVSQPSAAAPQKANIAQQISDRIAEKKEEFEASSMSEAEVKVCDNGVVQTIYDMVDGLDAYIIEYPNGKAAIMEGDTVTVYNVDGHETQYIKNGNNGFTETRDGKTVENSTVNADNILQILGARCDRQR